MEKNYRNLIIVVLYNCKIEECQTFKSLVDSSSQLSELDKICFWDNSPTPLTMAELTPLDRLKPTKSEYISTPENISLSKIYNNIIKENLNFEYVFILDQDSEFKNDYFQKFEEAKIENPDINLFAPLIKSHNVIASPGHFYSFKGKYWRVAKYGVVNSANTVAIASGLIININAFDKIGFFEERLNLYGIDTNFMIRYSRFFNSFYVMDVYFRHDLSDFNIESVQVKLRRFKSQKSSGLLNAELFPLHTKLITRLFYLAKSISYTIKYRNFRFFS